MPYSILEANKTTNINKNYTDDITYDEFIQNILETRGRFSCGDEYHERHHIIPKCKNGSNDKENLIDLFAREHFIAHKLLAKENPNEPKLIHAWALMSRVRRNNELFKITAEEYEEAKLSYIKLIKGKPFSEEHRKKIGLGNKGKVRTEEMIKRMSITNKRVWTEESKKKLSESMSGKNHPLFGVRPSEEVKRKISESNKGKQAGNKNPRALEIVQLDKNDNIIKVWKYIKQASRELHIHAADISTCAKSKLKSAGGYHWKYLYDNISKNGDVVLGAISLGLISQEEALRMLAQ